MSATPATSLKRGLAVLLAFESGRELGVTRVAELVGQDKGHVSRTLKVLAEQGLVERDPETLAYRLGWRLFALAAVAGDGALAAAAPSRLRELVRTFEEAAYLSVLQGAGVLTVLSEAPPRAVQAVNWVGQIVPAGCTSAGYALLLDHGPEELEPFLDHGLGASRDRLRQRLAAGRTRGFTVADEDFEAGLVGVAAPVRDFRGRIVAAVNVSAPKFRFSDRVAEAGKGVRGVADDLSRSLGWPGPGSMLGAWPSRSSSPSAERI